MSEAAVQTVILYVTAALAISVVLNILLKRLDISQVIGYIATGTIIAYAFDLRHLILTHSEMTHSETPKSHSAQISF